MARDPALYILTNRRNGTLYIGVTSNPAQRLAAHLIRQQPGFAAKHGLTRLVYLERHRSMLDAIRREKELKKWERKWKVALIEATNPYWRDLAADL